MIVPGTELVLKLHTYLLPEKLIDSMEQSHTGKLRAHEGGSNRKTENYTMNFAICDQQFSTFFETQVLTDVFTKASQSIRFTL